MSPDFEPSGAVTTMLAARGVDVKAVGTSDSSRAIANGVKGGISKATGSASPGSTDGGASSSPSDGRRHPKMAIVGRRLDRVGPAKEFAYVLRRVEPRKIRV